MRISSDQELVLFEMICLSGGNTFTYSDFVVFVCDPNHADVVWKTRRAIAQVRLDRFMYLPHPSTLIISYAPMISYAPIISILQSYHFNTPIISYHIFLSSHLTCHLSDTSQAKIHEREITAALQYQDSNSSGLVTAKQFNKAMKQCHIELSESDIQRLTLRFDAEESQRIDIDKFMKFIRGQPYHHDDDQGVRLSGTGALGARSKTLDGAETVAWASLHKRVNELLDTGYTGREVFALFDPDGKGNLDVAAIQQGAREAGTRTSPI